MTKLKNDPVNFEDQQNQEEEGRESECGSSGSSAGAGRWEISGLTGCD